jgi:AraC family transcriptional regulator
MRYNQNKKVIDVAQAYRFDHPETFSRAFKRVLGTTPSQWRERNEEQSPGLMPRLTPAHLQQISKGPYLKPSPVKKGPLRLAGLMSPDGEKLETVAGLWALLGQEVGRQPLAGDRNFYGLAQYTEGWQTGAALYLVGVEYPALEPIPLRLVGKEIPTLTWARFVHKGPRCDLPLSLDYFYHTWLPRSGRCLAQPWVMEQYGSHPPDLDDKDGEITILIPVQ